MKVDDPASDREPEAAPATAGGARGVGAVEALEDFLAVAQRDALSLVRNLDDEVVGP